MTEVDVALTDYVITVLCTIFIFKLSTPASSRPLLQKLWIVLFCCVGLAALIGGTVHGFFNDKTTLGYRTLWPITILLIGGTASCAWMLCGFLLNKEVFKKSWTYFAIIFFAIYTCIVLFVDHRFYVALAGYVPPMILFLALTAWNLKKNRTPSLKWILWGLIISFIAAGVQATRIEIHPLYFNFNSTYHLIQAIGLWILFRGAKLWIS